MSDSLPKALFSREEFKFVSDQLTECYAQVAFYQDLFIYSKYRVDLLNSYGGAVWRRTQKLLIDSILLSIRRLLDEPTSKRKPAEENLSIFYLFKKIGTFFPNKEEHYQQLEETKKTALLIINRCHKFIAHNDKKAIFSTKKEEIYLLDLTKTLDTLAEFMNHLNNYYYDTTCGYNRLIIRADRNARSILIQLEKARRYDQWLKEQPNQHEIYDEIVELIDTKPEES